MRIEKDIHHIEFNFKNGVSITCWQTLAEAFTWKKFNWNTYQFILAEFENDTMCGAYEFSFVLLCCGLRIRVPHKTKKGDEFWKDIKKSRFQIKHGCDGWVNSKNYTNFRKKKRDILIISNKKETSKKKKIFIQ